MTMDSTPPDPPQPLSAKRQEECLQKLDAASRELVEAVCTAGTQAIEVAQQQGCAPKTIHNKLNIIRRVLAECVQRRMAEAVS